jgi:dTDP-4-amino-4,6-dideoxygalactose transaminase
VELSEVKKIEFLNFNYDEIIPHIFVIKAKNRDKLREYLINNNIECGVHYKPNHLLTKYKSKDALHITEKIYEEILTLPCHFDLTENEQNIVVEKIREFYEN